MKAILVPVDFSRVTDQSTTLAGNLAIACGAKVVLIHVAQGYLEDFAVAADVPVPQMSREMLADQLKNARERLAALAEELQSRGCTVETVMVEGPIVPKICEEAQRRGIDMIVLGSHGHGQLHDLLMGSVSQGVIRRAGLPVLVVPSGDKEGIKALRHEVGIRISFE